MGAGDDAAGRAGLRDLSGAIDAFDASLDHDAEEFVRSYVQTGGNGGSEAFALLHTWAELIGRREAADLWDVLALGHLGEPEEGLAHALLTLRYGSDTAGYFATAEPALYHYATRSYEDVSFDDAHTLQAEIAGRRAELAARRAERDGNLVEARRIVLEMIATEAPRASLLADEFKPLVGASEAALRDASTSEFQVAQVVRSVRRAVAVDRGFIEPEIVDVELDESESERSAPRSTPSVTQLPQAQGESLERATVEVLRRIFDIGSELTSGLLARLRKQLAGSQGGFDIAFDSIEVEARIRSRSRCRVECKNLGRPLRIGDISDKLLQIDGRDASIDHWIVISPHHDPNNELSRTIDELNQRRRFPFEIHVWSPESGVDELFALDPDVHAAIYPGRACPSPAAAEARAKVLMAGLVKRLDIDESYLAYLREPWRRAFASEDADHLQDLLEDFVPLHAVDATGRPRGTSLQAAVTSWLDRSDGPEAMLVLGEFGDGKSVFTYQLAHHLAEQLLLDPERSIAPLRLPLREVGLSRDVSSYLQEQLTRLGIDHPTWRSVGNQHSTLVILDGFDEMSVELDARAVADNIRSLALVIGQLKSITKATGRRHHVLVTSRGRFFENPREEAAVREALNGPEIVRIASLGRAEVLAHLSRHAKQIGRGETLTALQRLYDPIGLASKPLFLRMIKDVLHILPSTDFNAAILYRTYVDESLRRKSELLDSPEPLALTSETIENLVQILELVAVKGHNSGGGGIDLRELGEEHGGHAQLLWKLANASRRAPSGGGGPPRAHEEDARQRVSIRSLLQPTGAGSAERWRVDFFHRSIGEYFLASAIVRALSSARWEPGALFTVLHAFPLSEETIAFTAQVVEGSDLPDIRHRLLSMVRGAVRGIEGQDALGGNALSLLYALDPSLEGVGPLESLNLDGVVLSGADLRGISFRGSSLRTASLDNADLTGADLRDCDLTGMRAERTYRVDAVCVDDSSGAVLTCYGDGVIREWSRSSGDGRWLARTIFTGLEARVRRISLLTPNMALIYQLGQAVIIGRSTPEWTIVARIPVSPLITDLVVTREGAVLATAVAEERSSVDHIVLRDHGVAVTTHVLDVRQDRISPSRGQPLWLEPLPPDVRLATEAEEDARSTRSPGGAPGLEHRLTPMATGSEDIVFVSDQFLDGVEAVNIVGYPRPLRWFGGALSGDALPFPGSVLRLFAVGTSTGRVTIIVDRGGHPEVVLDEVVHDGPVSSMRFSANAQRLVTGGSDCAVRIIALTEDGAFTVEDTLILALRCQDALIDGVEGPEEVRLLLHHQAGSEERDP